MAPPVLLKSRKTIKAVSNMGTKGIQRFHCSRCPHRLTYLKGEPRQEGYIVLQFSQQYCTAGKKYRMFKTQTHGTCTPYSNANRLPTGTSTPCGYLGQ